MKSIPLGNAAGTAKTTAEAIGILNTKAQTVVMGSYPMVERSGNAGVVDYFGEMDSLNVRGIPSPSTYVWKERVAEVAEYAHQRDKKVCVSVAAFYPEEYGVLALNAFNAGADMVELNFGCPNMQESGVFAKIISYYPEMVNKALEYAGGFGETWVKVSPIFDDRLLADLAGVISQRVDGIVAVNTLPQCLALDERGEPRLSFGKGVGGMAGPALKPIALAQVAKWVHMGFRVIGAGGITTGRDLLDYETVGAESCQVNTVIQREGVSSIDRIVKEASV